jgi:hypothetical protein
MRSTCKTLLATLALCTSFAAAQQRYNAVTQLNWVPTTGHGAPAAACDDTNAGQPYTDVDSQIYYVCGASAHGWVRVSGSQSPIQFTGPWSSVVTYTAEPIAEAAFYNNAWYVSLQNGNINQNPATATSYWALLFNAGGSPGMTGLVGDVTTPPNSSGSTTATLPNVNSSVGTCGDATHVGQVTLNAKGQTTGCTPVSIASASTTWPTAKDLVISNGTDSPDGLTPVNGNCVVGSAGSWVAGSCTSGVSAQIKYLSVAGCPQDSDGTAGGGTDGTACVNALYAGATATNPIVAWQDHNVTLISGNGLQCPVEGGCFLAGNGWGLSTVSITNCSVTANVATFTIASATLTVNQPIQLTGLGTCAALNQAVVRVLSSGLTSTQFEANVTPATIASGAEAGCDPGTPNGACGVTVLGTGFYLAANSGDIISNGVTPSAGNCENVAGAVPSRIGAGFGISNVFFNGNGPNQTNYCFGADFENANNIFIDNVLFYNLHKYAVKLGNVTQVDIDHLHVYATDVGPAAAINTDGIHVDGPASDIVIANSYFRTGDDAIALNAAEGYCGPILRVSITGSFVDEARSALRAYNQGVVCGNGLTPNVDSVTIDGYSGTVYDSMANLGFQLTGTLPATLNDLKWSNSVIDTQGRGAIGVQNNVGSLDLEDVTLKNVGNCVFCSGTTAGQTMATVKLHDLSLVGTALTSNAPTLLGNYSCACSITVTDLLMDGFSITNDPGGSWAASDPFNGSGNSGSITNLYASHFDMRLLNPTFGNVTNPNGNIGPNSWAINPAGGPWTFNAYGGGAGFDFVPHNTGGSAFNRFYGTDGNVLMCMDTNNYWMQVGGANTSRGCDSNYTAEPVFVSPGTINWNRKPGINGPSFGGSVGNCTWFHVLNSNAYTDAIHQQCQASGAGGPSDAQVIHSNGVIQDTYLQVTVFTVGTLPAASSLPAGTQVFVSDSVAYTPGVCAGGGSDYMIAVTDGSSVWSCH